MKHRDAAKLFCIPIVVAALLLSIACAPTQAFAQNPRIGNEAIRIELTSTGVYFNSVQIHQGLSLNVLKQIFGEPTRTTSKINNVYTFDDLGVLLYQKPESQKIVSVVLVYGEAENPEFFPKTFYKGILTVHGANIDSLATCDSFEADEQLAFKPEPRLPVGKGSFGNIIFWVLCDRKTNLLRHFSITLPEQSASLTPTETKERLDTLVKVEAGPNSSSAKKSGATQQEEQMRAVLRTYKIGNTTFEQYQTNQEAGSWKVYALRFSGEKSKLRRSSKSIIEITVGTSDREVCELQFEGNDLGKIVLSSLKLRP